MFCVWPRRLKCFMLHDKNTWNSKPYKVFSKSRLAWATGEMFYHKEISQGPLTEYDPAWHPIFRILLHVYHQDNIYMSLSSNWTLLCALTKEKGNNSPHGCGTGKLHSETRSCLCETETWHVVMQEVSFFLSFFLPLLNKELNPGKREHYRNNTGTFVSVKVFEHGNVWLTSNMFPSCACFIKKNRASEFVQQRNITMNGRTKLLLNLSQAVTVNSLQSKPKEICTSHFYCLPLMAYVVPLARLSDQISDSKI